MTDREAPTRGSMTATKRWRKKPVEVEAQQFDGTKTEAKRLSVEMGGDATFGRAAWNNYEWCLYIETAEGRMRATAGDWIIRDVRGEFYPCKPDIFAATYDPASPAGEGRPPREWALAGHPTAPTVRAIDGPTLSDRDRPRVREVLPPAETR